MLVRQGPPFFLFGVAGPGPQKLLHPSDSAAAGGSGTLEHFSALSTRMPQQQAECTSHATATPRPAAAAFSAPCGTSGEGSDRITGSKDAQLLDVPTSGKLHHTCCLPVTTRQ